MAVVAASVIGGSILVGAGASMYASSKASDTAGDAQDLAGENMDLQAQIAKDQLAFQKEQQAKLDAQKEVYRDFQFTNPYKNMENVYEDLTVNQQQAEFEKQMFQQSQADIMGQLKGAAGSSGIAGLAQTLANQGQIASQRASISIGQQESQNQIRERQQAAAIDMAERGGEAQVQQQEMSRQATLLGIEMGGMAGANAGVQSAYANQMAAGSAAVGALSAQSAAQYGLAGQYLQAGTGIAGAITQGMGSYQAGQS